MKLLNDPELFSAENVNKIEQLKAATYVCDTTHKGISVAVFYGRYTHPVSGSRYFALYRDQSNSLMITDGAFIETQEITGVIAKNGDVIFSRHRHDHRYSPDGSVFIDGGREYTRTNSTHQVTLLVRDGVLRILENV